MMSICSKRVLCEFLPSYFKVVLILFFKLSNHLAHVIEILDHWKNFFKMMPLCSKKVLCNFLWTFAILFQSCIIFFQFFFNSTNCMNSKTSLSTKVFLSSTFYFHVSDEHPKKVNVAFNGNWSLGLVQKNKLYSNYLL